jgi:co-chaperonin GroES (HSP10)
MKIQPINNHLIVEPVEHESFIASATGTFDEIGVVKALPPELQDEFGTGTSAPDMKALQSVIEVGDKVYFDSWLAAKYPTGEKDKTFWLVNYEDIRAVQKADAKEQE